MSGLVLLFLVSKNRGLAHTIGRPLFPTLPILLELLSRQTSDVASEELVHSVVDACANKEYCFSRKLGARGDISSKFRGNGGVRDFGLRSLNQTGIPTPASGPQATSSSKIMKHTKKNTHHVHP